MSLDTLANVKTRLGISGSTDDALLSLLMDAADSWVQNFTGRDFAGGTFTEYFPGNVATLQLANFPVTVVTSVKVDPAGTFGAESVIAVSSYAVHAERGVIQSKVGPFVAMSDARADWTRSPRAVQVVYTTATSAVPNDVEEAYARLIGSWYRQVKTESAAGFQNLWRQRMGDVTTTFQPPQTPPPREVEELLAPYRTPVL